MAADVATLIVEAAAAQYKKDCLESRCTVKMNFYRQFAEFAVDVIPVNKSVLIAYKTMKWRVDRADKEAYEEICAFIADCIKNDLECQMNNPDADLVARGRVWHQLTLQRQEQAVARWEFSEERIPQELRRAMSSLRLMV